MTYMKRFEDNKKVFSVRLCPPEAIFWQRGQMVGKKWAISENHSMEFILFGAGNKVSSGTISEKCVLI